MAAWLTNTLIIREAAIESYSTIAQLLFFTCMQRAAYIATAFKCPVPQQTGLIPIENFSSINISRGLIK